MSQGKYLVDSEYGVIDVTLTKSFIIDSENKYAMVFEYADGGSLRRYLSDTFVELDWLARLKLSINIVDGLRYLHGLDILHKDLVTINTVSAIIYNIILLNLSLTSNLYLCY